MKKHKVGIPYKDMMRNKKLEEFGEVEDECEEEEG